MPCHLLLSNIKMFILFKRCKPSVIAGIIMKDAGVFAIHLHHLRGAL